MCRSPRSPARWCWRSPLSSSARPPRWCARPRAWPCSSCGSTAPTCSASRAAPRTGLGAARLSLDMPLAVLGAGSWGTALAAHLARAGHPVSLWARDERVAADLNERRVNPDYLPGMKLPEGITASHDLAAVAGAADTVFVVVPSAFYRAVCREAARVLRAGTVLVSATKGLELDTLRR